MKSKEDTENDKKPSDRRTNTRSGYGLWSIFDAILLPFIFWRTLTHNTAVGNKMVKETGDGQTDKNERIKPQQDWEKARPSMLPKPTYWPFFTALGLCFIFWGLLTIWLILAAGILILAVSVYGWINLLRRE